MIRVLIADDHAIVRAGLRQFIADQPDMEIACEAGDGGEAIDFIRGHAIDVVLLDIAMPGRNGVDVLKQIKATHPQLPVLILSGYSEEQFALNLLHAGASGYLNKEAAGENLVAAIRNLASGGTYVSEKVGQLLVRALADKPGTPPHAALSERELQVFCRLARGEPTNRIAEALCVSPKTVSTYRARILQKMQLQSNAEIVAYALRHGLVT